MTANQINYAKLQEDIRHNQATEQESVRHNVEDERIRSDTNAINMASYQESVRHNVQSEAINSEHYGRMDEETARNHLAMELETQRTNQAREAETNRSNVATEQLRASELEEEVRHDKAVEKENKRHNKAEEDIGQTQAKAAESQAQTAAKNANTRYYEYLTNKYRTEHEVGYWNATVFVDQKTLAEKIRYDAVTTKETERHNKATEENQWQSIQNQFVLTPSPTYEIEKTKAITEAEKAKATESLARAGYLKTQEEWYAWNQIVNTAVDITQAVKNFSGAIPVIGMLVG